jgi:Undecaprenyl-phosphate glucose phosphotransferase
MALETAATGQTRAAGRVANTARPRRLAKCLALFAFDAAWLYTTAMASGWAIGATHAMHAVVAILLVLSALSLFAAIGLYRPDHRPSMPVQAVRALLAMAAMGVIVTLAVNAVHAPSAPFPGWIPAWAGVGAAGSSIARLAWHVAVHRHLSGKVEQPAFVVGTAHSLRDVLSADCERRGGTATPIGAFVIDGPASDGQIGRVPVLGRLEDLGNAVRSSGVETILIAVPTADSGTQARVFSAIAGLDVDGYLLLPALPRASMPDQGDSFGPYRTVWVQRRPLRDSEKLVKRVFDLIAGSAATLLASPALLLTAIAIKLDSRGPVLFKQPRYGYNDTLVTIYKFRTMYHDATDTQARRATAPDDPRVTRVGHLLRRTSMDELPQLFNVLQGRMSMVGPRPHAPESCAGGQYFHDAVPMYAVRHRVKPGMTGAAQVSGWRGPTETLDKLERRVEHDLWYMYHWSPALDLKILLRTPFALVGNNTF